MTVKCAKCGAATLPHRACEACGAYAERSIKATGMNEVKKVLDKKAKKPSASAKAGTKSASAEASTDKTKEAPAPEAKS